MKKHGILHHELASVIASLGHGQLIVIGDAGLPVPPGVRCIDLAVSENVPRFIDVVRAVLGEMQVERANIATETATVSPHIDAELRELLIGISTNDTSHHDLKGASATAVAVVRTGEFTPYANVALYAGVVF
jgi:D-ribose pyranase